MNTAQPGRLSFEKGFVRAEDAAVRENRRRRSRMRLSRVAALSSGIADLSRLQGF